MTLDPHGTIIKPTVGRIVWYHPAAHEGLLYSADQPLPAIVAYVWSDNCVNVAVFDSNGNGQGRQSVTLIQDGQTPPIGCAWVEWMPYQKGQAAKAAEAVPAPQFEAPCS